ncbi:hypothetical protein BJV78DRAFT_1150609 [Lactifluus subvellereus]|nr:hypothetical protein BJV78DRAFT_1150609 [Lactifluus subvellereus]
MSSAPFATHDNTRLATYRVSHLGRFHPYPRTYPPFHEERHMITIDHRFSEPSAGPVGDVAPMVFGQPTMAAEDNGKAENNSETSTMVAESFLRRKKLKTAANRLSVRPLSSRYAACTVENR